jgi:hypothetical protein
MMDTRLINQVIVWERILEIETEKQKNLHPKAQAFSSINSEPRLNVNKSIFSRIFKFSQDRKFSSHSSEPA